jgi:hypothetical protein
MKRACSGPTGADSRQAHPALQLISLIVIAVPGVCAGGAIAVAALSLAHRRLERNPDLHGVMENPDFHRGSILQGRYFRS